MNPTIRTFLTRYPITITPSRFEEFRKYSLEPGEYLQHPMFGDTTDAITDGVHIIGYFPSGIKEVHFNNTALIKPQKEPSKGFFPRKEKEPKEVVSIDMFQ